MNAPIAHKSARAAYAHAVTVIVASVLFAAATAKTISLLPISGRSEFNWDVIALCLIVGEVSLALLLLVEWRRRLTVVAAFLLFAGFGAAAFAKLQKGHDSCGCFGDLEVSPSAMLLLDISLLILLAIANRVDRDTITRVNSRWAYATRLCLVFACVSTVAMLLATQATSQHTVSTNPSTWVGETFPLLPRVDIADRLVEGKQRVLLVRGTCSHCRQLVASISAGTADFVQPGDIILDVPPYDLLAILARDNQIVKGQISTDLGLPTPLFLELSNSRVVSVSLHPWQSRAANNSGASRR